MKRSYKDLIKGLISNDRVCLSKLISSIGRTIGQILLSYATRSEPPSSALSNESELVGVFVIPIASNIGSKGAKLSTAPPIVVELSAPELLHVTPAEPDTSKRSPLFAPGKSVSIFL